MILPWSRPAAPTASAPAGSRIYAIGDIHGRLDLRLQLETKIAADAGRSRADRRVIVYLGDYVDRGPDSHAVVEHLAKNSLDGFERVLLKGNHEDMMIRFLAGEPVARIWFMNGGMQTLRSYGVTGLVEDLPAIARAALARNVPDHHRDFFSGLALNHVEGDYLFVHAGIRPGLALARQEEADLLWIREEFLDSAADHGKVVVHGHTITPKPERLANRIGIDTGAFMTGRLTALALEGGDARFITT
jgi:serine/threonine protein phosphatase 1